MKKIFLVALLFVPAMLFAQKAEVKNAQKLSRSGKTTEAFAAIEKAKQNDETKNQAKTWKVSGDIHKFVYDEENKKAYIRQEYDKNLMFSNLLAMFEDYIQCDKIEQQPNEKGKIKFKYRKKNADIIAQERINLINGGINFQDDSKKAFKYFAMYVDIPSLPMMAKKELPTNDTLTTEIAYYATMMASRLKDFDSTIKYGKIASDDKKNGVKANQLVCDAYKAKGDTVTWLNTLKEGISKYPKNNSYFFANLVDYYSNNGKANEAMKFADDMIAADPSNPFNTYVKGFLYMNLEDYPNAIKCYLQVLEMDPDYVEANLNLGWIYCKQAMKFSENASTDINDAQFAKDKKVMDDLYRKALPYYEKVRLLKPDNKDFWMNALYRIYYTLNMGNQLKEIEAMMENK
jgi:tetratricopeptide (TPR) repeat protein